MRCGLVQEGVTPGIIAGFGICECSDTRSFPGEGPDTLMTLLTYVLTTRSVSGSQGEMVAGAAVQGAVSGAVSGAVHSSMMPRGPSSTDMMLEGQLRQDPRLLDCH